MKDWPRGREVWIFGDIKPVAPGMVDVYLLRS
jgi:hypothetical protein